MARVNARVRPATGDDVLALAHLVQSVDTRSGVFSGKPLADAGTTRLAERFREILTQDERIVLVAADDTGELVGMLSARSDDVGAVDLTPVLHVTHLMVDPGHRRRGIGRSLLTSIVERAEQGGIEHVLATAATGSREGNRYLARLGFAPLVAQRIAPTSTLRRSLGMTDSAGRVAVLRRARLIRAQRASFAGQSSGRSV